MFSKPHLILVNEGINEKVFYSKEVSLLIVQLKDVNFIDETDYKKNALAILDFIRNKKIKYLIFDTSNFKTIFTAQLQKWIAYNVNRHIMQLVDKIAIIQPTNPISQLSLQIYFEESHKYGHHAEEHFFVSEEDAFKWILKE